MINIENRSISESDSPFIIAELSANHNGSLEQAKLSIKAAKDCGAHAVKIQSYTADTMTIDCDRSDFKISDGPWKDYSLYDLYTEAQTPFEWHAELFQYARELGITIFSTPFDESAVDLLEELNTPIYKIASFEITDLPLISYIAKKKKPIFISTGMASENEISEALEAARSNGCDSLLLFHCISSYPTPIENANLNKILNLKKTFGVSVGLSDHTIGSTAAIAATILGACAIEKHFTLSRKYKGPDSDFSIEPLELSNLVIDTRDAWLSLGNGDFTRPEIESSSLIFRRSIYFIRDLKSGHVITKNDIKRIRPGFGLPSKYFDSLLGRTVKRDISRGEATSFADLE